MAGIVTLPVSLSNVGTVVPVGLVTVRVTFPPTPTVGVTVPPILSLFKIFGMVRVDVLGAAVIGSDVTVNSWYSYLNHCSRCMTVTTGLSDSHSL